MANYQTKWEKPLSEKKVKELDSNTANNYKNWLRKYNDNRMIASTIVLFLIALASGFLFVFYTERILGLWVSFLVNAGVAYYFVKKNKVLKVQANLILLLHLLVAIGVTLTVIFDGK